MLSKEQLHKTLLNEPKCGDIHALKTESRKKQCSVVIGDFWISK